MSRWSTFFLYCIFTAAVAYGFGFFHPVDPEVEFKSYVMKVLGCAGGLVFHWAGSK